MLILKKDLKNFEVDSNLGEVKWMNFIVKSADWLLETKDEWENEIISISLIVEEKKDEAFSWDEECKVQELLLGMKESNEE